MIRRGKIGGWLLAAALGCCSGCFWIEGAQSPLLGENAVEHVSVSNYGWTLFGCIPIVCGNADTDSWCPFTFFKDEIKSSYAYDALKARAAEKGCELQDVFYLDDNDVLFDAYYTAVPWIIVYKETNLSANLVKKEAK